MIQIFMMVNVSKADEDSESIWAGLFWLLDNLEDKGQSKMAFKSP